VVGEGIEKKVDDFAAEVAAQVAAAKGASLRPCHPNHPFTIYRRSPHVHAKPAHKRILLKLSGEALMGDDLRHQPRDHRAHGGGDRRSDPLGCRWRW
jgi:hypothetical protein